MKNDFNKPLVSIVMPVYNGEKYLQFTIESILSQSYSNFEFIVIDDCSTDSSLQIIQKYAGGDKRIKSYQNPVNLGIAKNRNVGLSHLRGKYYMVIDQDDICIKQRIEKQVAFLESNPDYAAVGGQVQIINETGELLTVRNYKVSSKEIISELPVRSPLCHPATMIRVSDMKTLGGKYDSNFPGAEEYDLWFQFAFHKYQLVNLPDFLIQYRISEQSYKLNRVKRMLILTLRKSGFLKNHLSALEVFGDIF